MRSRVVMEFLKEAPGTGKGNLASKYRYNVEQLSTGKWVYLERPGFLNKQFDFVINVEDVDFGGGVGRVRRAPTHEDIFVDLEMKKQHNSSLYCKLYELILRLYLCEEPSTAEYRAMSFGVGYPVDMVLAIVKWYFIEQDVAYWNYSGRAMFMTGIPEPSS